MIVSASDFERQTSAIEEIIWGDYPPRVILRKSNTITSISPKEEYEKNYKNNFVVFPLYTTAKRDDIYIQTSFVEQHRYYHHFVSTPKDDRIKASIPKYIQDLTEESILDNIHEYINERILNMVFDFREAMTLLKEGHVFACVDDPALILKNLLNYYQQVRVNQDIQISFFFNLLLPKEIADLMLDILIELIMDKLQMMEIDCSVIKGQEIVFNQPNFKLNWLGSQQDFAELILELKNKNYLSFPESESIHGISRRFVSLFDFSSSMRKKDSKVEDNICTYLKPVYDKDLKLDQYFFDKKGYKRKFDGIPVNNKLKTVK